MQEVKVFENKKVILNNYVDGIPKEEDMEVKFGETIELKAPKGSSYFLVKNLYLSCDPYMRGLMRHFHGSYLPPFVHGQLIEGFGVARVIDSDDANYKPGDVISGFTGWEEYSLIRSSNELQLRKIQLDEEIPLSYHLGLLGMAGFTAYAGFYEICCPKNGESVFVSAASGAVGQLVGQLAKFAWLLCCWERRQQAKGISQRGYIYFDNVGGSMLDAAFLNMRVRGRIALCGMVSLQSLSSSSQGINNLYNAILKRIRLEGFLQSDYLHKLPEFLEHVKGCYKEGEIVYIEDISEGLELAPASFVGLFSGKNISKQVI